MSYNVYSNAVPKRTLERVNYKTLKIMAAAIIGSFGPYGAMSQIKSNDMLPRFTKDGHSILGNLQFNGIIENSLREVMETLTRHIVKEVGDGTSSAVMMSYYIYKRFIQLTEPNTNNSDEYYNIRKYPPVKVEKTFKKIVQEIKDIVLAKAKTADPETMRKIAMISTNSNEEISDLIEEVYKTVDMDVYIDVKRSNVDKDYLRVFDGMTLNTGYADKAYITNEVENTAEINHPKIYFFEDPIDTPEMIEYLQNIITKNIVDNIRLKQPIEPTVIICPKVSNDVSVILDGLHKAMAEAKSSGFRIPFLMISNIHQPEIVFDVMNLCEGKSIKKYINFDVQAKDQEAGLAPTADNVHEFFGTADAVVADFNKTKFINPKNMYKEGTQEYSDQYNQLVKFMETQLEKAKEEGKDLNYIGNLRRRYNSLKANMVDLYIGGATPEERDARFDAAEDAVLNCMSAAINGYGWGSNLEGLLAVLELKEKYDIDTLEGDLLSILENSYKDIMAVLYGSECNEFEWHYTDNSEEIKTMVNTTIEKKSPRNIATGEWDEQVISSIYSDIAILEIIAKLLPMLINCRYFLCPSAPHNTYIDC